MISCTEITATNPEIISKGFYLDGQKLEARKGGNLKAGGLKTLRLRGVEDLAEKLTELTEAQAMAWGICQHQAAEIVTNGQAARLQRLNPEKNIVARSRDYFAFDQGPAIFMLDYDPAKDQKPLPVENLLKELYSICPEIETAPHIVKASASSFIYNNGTQLKGPGGWRILVVVKNGADIPRAGDVFFKKCWLAGHGRLDVSKSAAILVRGLFDASVWQPERLDFCGPAACTPPLHQKQPQIQVFNPDGQPLDTFSALPDLEQSEAKKYFRMVARQKKAIRPELKIAEDVYIDKKARKISRETGQNFKIVKEKYSRAVKEMILLGDFELLTAAGQKITVAEILEKKELYHEARFADPLEPEYNNDERISWANLLCEEPYIFSHAHGDRKFTLHACTKEIRVVNGRKAETIKSLIQLLKLSKIVYVRNNELVILRDEKPIPLELDSLLILLDEMAVFSAWNKKQEKFTLIDAPKPYAAGLLASRHLWEFDELTNIVTTPAIELPSMRIIDSPGFDKETGLFYHPEPGQEIEINTNITIDDVKKAIDQLWEPFKLFPFDSDLSKGVMLSAILTACCRQSLPTAPGFLFTAPVAGSGKSFISSCLGILAGEHCPASISAPAGRDGAAEMQKTLVALARDGAQVIILDNLTGIFESSTLCAWLTSEKMKGRLLGLSQSITINSKFLFIGNGNNVILKGDMCRRVLECCIDPEMEKPYARKFNFDPRQYCRANKSAMVSAAYTLLLYGQRQEPPAGRLASFETWNDTVRRAVFACIPSWDPMAAIDKAYAEDPDTQKLAAFLSEAYDTIKSLPFTTNEIAQKAQHETDPLYYSVSSIAEIGGVINKRVLGRWLEKKEARIIDGLCLTRTGKKKHNSVLWQIVEKG